MSPHVCNAVRPRGFPSPALPPGDSVRHYAEADVQLSCSVSPSFRDLIPLLPVAQRLTPLLYTFGIVLQYVGKEVNPVSLTPSGLEVEVPRMSCIEIANEVSSGPHTKYVSLWALWTRVVYSFVTTSPVPPTLEVLVFLLHLIEKAVTFPKSQVSLAIRPPSLLGSLPGC